MYETVHPNGELLSEPLHLRHYWFVLLRRRWLAILVMAIVVGAGVARVFLLRPLYQASAQLMIERIPNVLETEKDPRASEGWDDFFQTQCRLLQSRLLARRTMEGLGLLRDVEFQAGGSPSTPQDGADAKRASEESAVDVFLQRLKIDAVKGTQLVTVSFRSFDAQRAADVANALAEAYVQQILDFGSRATAERGSRLDNETAEQSQKVAEAEVALQKFNEKEGLLNIEERRTLLEQKLKDLGASLTTAKTRRLDKEALFRQMRTASNPEALAAAIGNPVIQSLRGELASLERQASALLAKGYLEDFPDVVKVREQMDGTRQKIAIEAERLISGAENDYRVALAQEASASGALEAAKAEALDLSRRSLRYDAFKRDLEASKKVSEDILDRQKATDAARGAQLPNVHVIDAATKPLAPARPRPVRDVALSLVAGAVCAVIAAFVREYLDTAVSKPGDVRRLGRTLLAVIPDAGRRKVPPVVMNGHRKEPFAEGYRVLRAALRPPGDGRGQALLVTSTLPGEGKSLTSVNLALTLSSSDERVLLVEADLRRPSLGRLLGSRAHAGLSEVLTGVASLEQAIYRVPGTRLSALLCGTTVQKSSADLLAASRLRDLLVTLRSSYDRVILDAPPAGAVADALTLAPLADAVVIVVACGQVGAGDLVQTLERLERAGAHILGLVLNRARPDRHGYDYGPSFAADAFRGSALVPSLSAGAPGRAAREYRRSH